MSDFEYTTDDDFDGGDKTQVETANDWPGHTANQLQLELGDIFQHTYDGETEGTSPPSGWTDDSGFPCANLEVDDAQYKTSPHSQYMKTSAAGSWCHRDYASGFDGDGAPYNVYIRIPDTNGVRALVTNQQTGDHNAAKILIHLLFQTDHDIEYYDGAYQDTLYDWSEDTWHLFKAVHDCGNNQFDLWFDTTKIVTNGGFRNAGASVKALHWQILTAGSELWCDEVRVGDFYSTGNWVSPSISMTSKYMLKDITITLNGSPDASNCIDKVEVLDASDDSVLYTCTTDQTATVTLDQDDFGGTFLNTYDTNIKIKVYLKGDGSTVWGIADISGNFEEVAGVFIDEVVNDNVLNWEVVQTITKTGGRVTAELDNTDGLSNSDGTAMDDVRVYTTAGNQIFRGRLYNFNPEIRRQGEIIKMLGYGYIRDLMMRRVTKAYSSKSRSFMVDDLVTAYSDITGTNIASTSESLDRTIVGISPHDAVLQLSDELGYEFWVDFDNDFHWDETSVTPSGLEIVEADGDVVDWKVLNEGTQLYNRVMVYGSSPGGTQIVEQVDDPASQLTYGVRQAENIVDLSIETAQEAYDRGIDFITKHSTIIPTLEIKTTGYETLSPGETVNVQLDNSGVDDGEYLVLERKQTLFPDITTLKLAQWNVETEEIIADLIRRMRMREMADMDSAITPVQVEMIYEDLEFTLATLIIQSITYTDAFLYGHSSLGQYGRTAYYGRKDITVTEEVNTTI